MNEDYTDVLNFLTSGSDDPFPASALPPDDIPASGIRREHMVPRLFWEDVFRLECPLYDTVRQEYHILLAKSARQKRDEHTHSYFEVIYVLSGSSSHCINGHMETMHAGDLCILPPAARHTQFLKEDNITARLLVLPSYFTDLCPGLLYRTDALGSFLANGIYAPDYAQYLLFHTNEDPAIRTAILSLGREILKYDDYSNLIASGLFMSLLVTLARNHLFKLQMSSFGNAYREILSVLRQEYDTITLEALAKHLHYSVPYCSKYIKKLFGMNFSSLLRQVRFQTAVQYLQYSNLTVIQISKKLGYENPENFIRAFKSQFHLTPAQYRKNCISSNNESVTGNP